MFELFKDSGRGGVVGFLFGLVFVTWINPGTNEGIILLLIICVFVGALFALLVSILFRSRTK